MLDNWGAKVSCLVIAILLYIFNQASEIDKKTFVIPLRIQENGLVMHVGTVPYTVPLVVRTSEANMNMITAADFEAFVNLDSITESGTFTVPVFVSLSSKIKELDPVEVLHDR